eukprot:CAMPEP_0172166554 /NCGR_PEP_ID=MMETSP1050-20130122/9055_1 /TAXON_ID=233186 /ORGANISM="Cryptomonas curvata, Strain CCAP979/52" /LENGTH=327 /DNA_ID=CAMNT_0012837195 /DNA_START=1512 /DNA_END=2493 /DNA_ORIENTATION=+
MIIEFLHAALDNAYGALSGKYLLLLMRPMGFTAEPAVAAKDKSPSLPPTAGSPSSSGGPPTCLDGNPPVLALAGSPAQSCEILGGVCGGALIAINRLLPEQSRPCLVEVEGTYLEGSAAAAKTFAAAAEAVCASSVCFADSQARKICLDDELHDDFGPVMEAGELRLEVDQAADCICDCWPDQLQLQSKEDTAASADRQSFLLEVNSPPHAACKAATEPLDSAPSTAGNCAHASIFDGCAGSNQDAGRCVGETAPDVRHSDGCPEAEWPEVVASRDASCLSKSGWIRLLVKVAVLAGIVLLLVFAGQKAGLVLDAARSWLAATNLAW